MSKVNRENGRYDLTAAGLKSQRRRYPRPQRINGIRPLLLLLFFLAACTPSMTPVEPVTLVFAFPDGMFDRDDYDTAAAEFTALYPHITVEVTPNGWETSDAILGPEWVLRPAQQENRLISLDALVEQEISFDLQDFYPSAVDQLRLQGELWGIPAGVEMALLFYNRDLFDTYGVPYPQVDWTWDDFLNTALALRQPEADVFGYVPWEGDLEYLDALPFVYQHGGQILDDWQAPSRTTFDDPLTLEALAWYADLFQRHEVAPTPIQVSQAFMGQVDIGIMSGKAGMWIDSLMSQRQAGEDWDFALGIASLPRDTHSITLAWVYGYAITSQSVHREESWLWIEYLSRQLSARMAPARRSLAESAEYALLMGDSVVPIRRALEEASMISYWTLYSQFQGELRQFQFAMARIVKGEATPQELLDRRP